MSLKWIGALGIALAGALWGISAVGTKHTRSKALETVICWLNDLLGRLRYTAIPMPQWIRESEQNPSYCALGFLRKAGEYLKTKDFTDAFLQGLQDEASKDGLSDEDIMPLMILGEQLGKTDVITQVQHIQECLDRVAMQKQKADAGAHKADRLYLTLGASVGLMVAILLL
jgi:stage III sporulation protein AB